MPISKKIAPISSLRTDDDLEYSSIFLPESWKTEFGDDA